MSPAVPKQVAELPSVFLDAALRLVLVEPLDEEPLLFGKGLDISDLDIDPVPSPLLLEGRDTAVGTTGRSIPSRHPRHTTTLTVHRLP